MASEQELGLKVYANEFERRKPSRGSCRLNGRHSLRGLLQTELAGSLVLHALAVDGDKVIDHDEDHGRDAEAVRNVGERAVRDHLRGASAVMSQPRRPRITQ